MIYEERGRLSDRVQDINRAIDSLKEEVEAVTAYIQRAEASKDENLKRILLHNSKEEKEHASMLLEWIRQNDKEFAKELEDYMFSKEKDLTKIEGHH